MTPEQFQLSSLADIIAHVQNNSEGKDNYVKRCHDLATQVMNISSNDHDRINALANSFANLLRTEYVAGYIHAREAAANTEKKGVCLQRPSRLRTLVAASIPVTHGELKTEEPPPRSCRENKTFPTFDQESNCRFDARFFLPCRRLVQSV